MLSHILLYCLFLIIFYVLLRCVRNSFCWIWVDGLFVGSMPNIQYCRHPQPQAYSHISTHHQYSQSSYNTQPIEYIALFLFVSLLTILHLFIFLNLFDSI